MRVFSSEPLQYIRHKLKQPDPYYDQEEIQYEEAWLWGDNPEGDISSLIKQRRLQKRD